MTLGDVYRNVVVTGWCAGWGCSWNLETWSEVLHSSVSPGESLERDPLGVFWDGEDPVPSRDPETWATRSWHTVPLRLLPGPCLVVHRGSTLRAANPSHSAHLELRIQGSRECAAVAISPEESGPLGSVRRPWLWGGSSGPQEGLARPPLKETCWPSAPAARALRLPLLRGLVRETPSLGQHPQASLRGSSTEGGWNVRPWTLPTSGCPWRRRRGGTRTPLP